MTESRDLLEKTLKQVELSDGELRKVFAAMLSGQLNDAQIAAFLTAWRMTGETAQLLTVGAKYLREHANKPAIAQRLRPLCDNCGTGGSGIPKFNHSTAAAIVTASCGVRIAKHGNRSVSSKCGSADLLFEAGFPTKLDDAKTIDLLEKTALTFFFAPNFHPVIANVMPVRRQLGVKTVFNLLGPLANPLAPEIQLLGVGHKLHMRPVAEALLNLGVQKALVVHSTDGLDEISPAAMTWGLFVENKTINDFPIEPKDFGIRATLTGILGQDATYNLQVLQRILNGERSEASEGVVLNTAVLLWLTDAVGSINDGVTLARQKLNDGSSYKFFKDWIRQANA